MTVTVLHTLWRHATMVSTDTQTPYPTGVIPRVEVQHAHKQFVDAVSPSVVMLKLTHARRLVKRDETASSYFGSDTDVIVTTTVNDTALHLTSWEQERDLIAAFEPTYHIPTDYTTYETQSAETRRENIAKCMQGTQWMQTQLDARNVDTTIIPLVKGLTPAERELCYETFAEAGFTYAGFYATQYFTGNGNQIAQLEADIETIVEETDDELELLVIGLLAPQYVERLPPAVVAVAGQRQWRTRVTPRTQSPSEMNAAYDELVTDVTHALDRLPDK